MNEEERKKLGEAIAASPPVRLGLPPRSECTCDCHEPGVVMMHFMPCCYEPKDDE